VYRVYDYDMKSQELITLLKRNGWVLRGSKGSHHIFVHPQHPGHLSVPHPKQDLGMGLVHKLMKQAQIHYPQG
jgi:predicted RNA binding protein YcfA (HicA-like mRNA interferase family)